MHHEEKLVQLGQALKERGIRLTPQRLMILDAVMSGHGHVSVEAIHGQVAAEYPDINLSTVYRTLETFRDLGVVTQTDLGSGRIEYHFAEQAGHHHLVCRRCGSVAEVDTDFLRALKETFLREYGFQAEMSHFAIFGICAECGDGSSKQS